MSDKRAYFKVDVGYFTNPKIAELLDESPRAVQLHLAAIAYCAQHSTDGLFPMRLVMRQACAEQSDLHTLMQCGLLLEVDERRAEVHDYLKHQRSADEVKAATKKAKRAAGARWNAPSNASSMPDALPDAMQREREREKEKNPSSDVADATPDQDASRIDVERLCSHLATRIEGNGAKRPSITKSWRDAARLMLDRDGRPEAQIHWLIDWCQADEFWRSNILSMPKLREKFDQLMLRARPPEQRPAGLPTDQFGNPIIGRALDDRR